MRWDRARDPGSKGLVMSNDAKLGLVLGVAIVVVIALVFFRSDNAAARLPTDKSSPTASLKKDAPAHVASAAKQK
jgi:cell division protein FtsN